MSEKIVHFEIICGVCGGGRHVGEVYPDRLSESDIQVGYKLGFCKCHEKDRVSQLQTRADFAQEEVERLQARVKELECEKKKAFWWSAEFTHQVHDGKIQQAWEDYLYIEGRRK